MAKIVSFVHLKSGSIMAVHCDEVIVKERDRLVEVSFVGMSPSEGPAMLYLDVERVEAVTYQSLSDGQGEKND